MIEQLKKHRFAIAVILIFFLGSFVRIYKFDLIPFGLPHDGALEGLEAIELSKNPLPYRPYSFIGWQGESLFRYFLALLIRISGPTLFIIKLGSTIFSLLTLPAFYLIAKRIFPKDKYLVLFSLFFLAISGWHIIMGKTIWRVITFPFFECLFLWSWLYLLKKPHKYLAIITAFLFALTLNTYNSARVLPLIPFTWLLLILINKKGKIKNLLKPITIFVLSSLLFLIPLISFAIKYPKIFNSRADSLFIGNQIKKENSLKPLVNNLVHTGLMFNVKAGGDDFFVNEPLLDQPASILFVIGIIYCLYKVRKIEYQLILTGFLINLVPGFFTIPNGNRAFGALPFVYLIIGAGTVCLTNIAYFLFKRKYLIPIFVFLSAWGTFTLYQIYFGPHSRTIFGFNPEATLAGEYMKDQLSTTDSYLTDNFPRDTLTYLTYAGGNPYQKHYTWLEKNTDLLSVNPRFNRQTAFFMFPLPQNQVILEALQKKFPTANTHKLDYCWLFIVSPPQKPAFEALSNKMPALHWGNTLSF